MVRNGGPAAPVSHAGTATATSTGASTQATAAQPGRQPRGGQCAVRASAASPKPVSTTAKETSGVPPSAASRRNGPSAWENATLPQEKPPNGNLAVKASVATQSAAIQTGAAGRRVLTAMSAQPSPTNSASIAAS